MRKLYWAVLCAAVCAALSACAFQSRAALPAPAGGDLTQTLGFAGTGKIRHVVYIVQENRSFNDLFMGYPGAETVTSGKDSLGETVALQPVSLTHELRDRSLGARDVLCVRWNGQTARNPLPNGRLQLRTTVRRAAQRRSTFTFRAAKRNRIGIWRASLFWPITCTRRSSTRVLWRISTSLQRRRTRASTCPAARGAVKAGLTTGNRRSRKSAPTARTKSPCFRYQTLGDELDGAGLSWRFYTSSYTRPLGGYWSGYQAVKHIFNGPDWKKDIITPQKRFLRDVKAGKLASFTWITPLCPDSDHLACGGGLGPSWVTSLVNAVGESKFWDSTAVFVQWDDWGGIYDPVPPPFKDYDSLGFRVPLIVISAYAKRNYVSHVPYETASVLRFAEDLFGLAQLSQADTRATSPAADCFDFSQKPRTFVPIKAPKGPDFFLRQANDGQIPDEQ